MLKQLDLCSGVGVGFPLAGLQTGGFELVGLGEIDEWCSELLSKRYSGVPNYGDVRSLPVRDIRKSHDIDIITASPPCQPFSIQGKRRGAADERDCFPAVKRAIESIRPRYFCIENVPGLLSCQVQPGSYALYFYRLLKQFARLGYDAEWRIVGSGDFGAPFRRDRLLWVGVSRSHEFDWERAAPWTEPIGGSVEKSGGSVQNGSSQPALARDDLRNSVGLDEPIGIQSGNGTVRARRAALGNALDPRVAAVALRRVLYLESCL